VNRIEIKKENGRVFIDGTSAMTIGYTIDDMTRDERTFKMVEFLIEKINEMQAEIEALHSAVLRCQI
jgi:hypothetical protein